MANIQVRSSGEIGPETIQLLNIVREVRNIAITVSQDSKVSAPVLPSGNLLSQISALSTILAEAGCSREADAFREVHSLALLDTDFGGLALKADEVLSDVERSRVLFLTSAWLEALNSMDRSKRPVELLASRPEGRRGMTLSEKIFAAHDIERRGVLKPGDMVRVDVDWVMASEISWTSMKKTYDSLGKPGIFRNDRFWLAGDHVVDPRLADTDLQKELVKNSEVARDSFKMTNYQGMNYTIMHTEFYRERAQPGMLIIGSDSHTCSSGSLGCLAIGLGAADVTMPLITGETWFRVPESVNIRFINDPKPGVGGKDIILYILKELKRNTIASDRVVEFTGPGIKHLSCDARFAIANMTTEFGGITGIFVPDQITYDFVNQRKSPRYKKDGHYFRPDADATYCSTHVIDLAKVESFVALYPAPDDVVPISTVEGKHLDGCFIGACTTAEEDLILAGLVLELGLSKGLKPVKAGKRKVVPGSMPILRRLKEMGLVDIYEQAGFVVGIPGCSYCVGMGADRAGEGEVWISSQNRNFENRMGKGAFGNLASAASVAASSFDMKITSPQALLDEIDLEHFRELCGRAGKPKSSTVKHTVGGPTYVEPSSGESPTNKSASNLPGEVVDEAISATEDSNAQSAKTAESDILHGKVTRLGDFIDTDALAPAEFLMTSKTDADFGAHCLQHTHPDFRQKVADGFNIVVAGRAFGCGSSRENAVNALLGAGVQCVIAKSFAFIYGRNQPNLGLLGIEVTDEKFYKAAVEGADIEVDLVERKIKVKGGNAEEKKTWTFELSDMEKELIKAGGMVRAFEKFGKKLFEVMCTPMKPNTAAMLEVDAGSHGKQELVW